MPTRCNWGFYCRYYCLLNIFRAPLCPSSGGQEYYTVVAACGISCCGFQVAGLVWSWGLCVRFAECCSILQTGHFHILTTMNGQNHIKNVPVPSYLNLRTQTNSSYCSNSVFLFNSGARNYGDLLLCKWMNAIFLTVEIMQVFSCAVCEVLLTVT